MKKLTFVLLLLLVPALLQAEQIGFKVGGVEFNDPGVFGSNTAPVIGTEILLKYDSYDMDFRLSFDFCNEGKQVVMISPALKYNFPSDYLWPYIGAGMELVLINGTPQRHALGPVFFGGIEPFIGKDITLFIEIKFIEAKSGNLDLGSKSINWGIRWLLK